MLIGYIHPVHRWRFLCYFSCNVCALGDARWEGEGGSGTMFVCVCGCACVTENCGAGFCPEYFNIDLV